jgi:mRNA interferase HicA
MKRAKLMQHLRKHGCELVREGARHSIWRNPASAGLTAVPRHTEIKETIVRKICSDLDIQRP